MFGEPGSFEDCFPEMSHAIDAPVPRAELLDIVGAWPKTAPEVLSRIAVPVHYRMGEHDRLWLTNEPQVGAFAACLTSAPYVDARLIPNTGHCVDLHRAGTALHLEQLAFALSAVNLVASDSARRVQNA